MSVKDSLFAVQSAAQFACLQARKMDSGNYEFRKEDVDRLNTALERFATAFTTNA